MEILGTLDVVRKAYIINIYFYNLNAKHVHENVVGEAANQQIEIKKDWLPLLVFSLLFDSV